MAPASTYPEQPGITYTIKSDRWDKNMAYGFGVWEVDPVTNTYKSSTSLGWNGVGKWQDFDLPINPSNISMSIPFAINTMATTRGILEEHNGVVFRHISITGTTGVATGKRKGGWQKKGGVGGFLGAIFSNTLTAAADAVNQIGNISALLSGKSPYPPLVSAIDLEETAGLGYAKLHELLNYFVAYATAKKNGRATNARLVFYNRKDAVTYVVTPVSFDINKSADSPHLYNYKITLKAWAIAEGSIDDQARSAFDFAAASGGTLTRMKNVLKGARSILSSSSNTIRAVARDFNAVFSIGNEAMLVVKDAGEFVHTAADFPEMMANQWNYIARGFKQKAQEVKDSFTGGSSPASEPHGDRSMRAALKSFEEFAPAADTRATENPNDAAGPAVDARNPMASTNDTISNVDMLDQYSLDELNVSPTEQEAMDAKVARANALTINDWDVRRRKIEDIRDAYADSRGLSDASYDAAARRSSVAGTRRLPTTEDYVILTAFNDMISVIDGITATNDLMKRNLPDPFARARAIVGDSGITITSATSAFTVPFPYNGSLETLAATYLGNPDKWIDIAILNDLKSPFIDETGFIRSLTTSGNGNSFTVSDKTNLHPNQEIFLSSSSQRQEKRRIVKINELGVDNFLVTVDGLADLDRFVVNEQAKMKAYLPNTINSSMVILIPLSSAATTTGSLPDTREIPATMNLNQQEKLMGADIGLTENFDLAVKNDGDVVISVGLANAIQAIKLKLATEKGQLKRHQEYGAGLPVGQKLDVAASDMRLIIENAIMSDPRFTEVPDIQVQFDNSTVRLNITVKVANEGGVIPVSFTL